MAARAGYDPQKPWNALPELPPEIDMQTPEVLKACIRARVELARVSALGEALPNQSILVHALPLQEARSSSEIENIVTTSDALYQALASGGGNGADPGAKEVLRYREALWEGLEWLTERPILNAPLFERICSRIRGVEVRARRGEKVAIVNSATQRAIYTPPAGAATLRRLLNNLERFLGSGSGDLDPLIKMAVMHYQFEAIHPFADGNGRTGRILNILYLCSQGLLKVPVIYLSRFFIEHREDYYRGLRSVTENGAWREWILYVLAAVEETSRDTIARIGSIQNLVEDMSQRALGTLAAKRKGFIEILFKWPYSKIGIVERELKCGRITAKRYLDEMVKLNLLKQVKAGRSYYYINTRLVDLLGE